MRRTKIVATVGPATSTEAAIGELVGAGVDVFRLNFSHGSRATHGEAIARIRAAADRLGRTVAILQDLSGPKIRTGRLRGGSPLMLHAGDELHIVVSEEPGEPGRITTTYADLPYKFEAGTPDIAGAIGLAAALEYVAAVGLDRIAAYEHELLAYATSSLSQVPGLRLTGTARDKASVLSFVLDDIHPHDVGTILDREGVAVRAGHHCCQPLMARLGVPATVRVSFAIYNTRAEIDVLVRALDDVGRIFR